MGYKASLRWWYDPATNVIPLPWSTWQWLTITLGIWFGRCLCNRLLSGSSMRFTVRSFGCTLRRALYWELYLQISSLTVGVWRSLRITIFGTYQGASTIMHKALIGNVLEFLCWKWKPYPRVVFHKSIFCNEKFVACGELFDFRPSNQYILVRVIPSCLTYICILLLRLCGVKWDVKNL
jgi:hypothetical protein